MKKILIYSSKTGNTKKIADSIKEVVKPDLFVDVLEFDINTISETDFLIIGGWIDRGYMNKEIMDLIHKLKNLKVAFFFTLGAYPNSMHAFDCIKNIKNVLLKNNNEVFAHYHCQGSIDSKLIDWMKSLPSDHPHSPNDERVKRWRDASMHPNQEDLNSAQNFAANLINLVGELDV